MTIMFMGLSKEKQYIFSQEMIKQGRKAVLKPDVSNLTLSKTCQRLVCLDFGYDNPKYLFYQNLDNSVAVRKINKMGGLADIPSDSQQWNSYYPNVFGYRINSSVFIGGQNTTNGFFIEKVSSEGKLGQSVFNNDQKWNKRLYSVLGHVNINGRHFLYAHADNSDTNNPFFIQEIHESGELGDVVYNGTFKYFYSSMGTVNVEGNTFLFAQTKNTRRYFMQGINSSGKLFKEESDQDNPGNFYDWMGSVTLDGVSCIYGSSVGKKAFFVQQVLPDGKLGTKYFRDDWEIGYDSVVPVEINARISPSNWMQGVYNLLPEETQKTMTLKDFCMPASHDAGMYKLTSLASIVGKSWVKTQEKRIIDQLERGVRYFDFRIETYGSPKQFYFVHTFSGPKLKEALEDIQYFMRGSNETLILSFTHFKKLSENDTEDFLDMLYSHLGDYLLKRRVVEANSYNNPSSKRHSINDIPYSKLQGKIIVIIDSDEDCKHFDLKQIKNQGNIYRAWIYSHKKDAQRLSQDNGSYMNIYDHYADSDDVDNMIEDQLSKFKAFGKQVTDGYYEEDSLLAIDWTLTPKGMTGVKTLATKVNDLLLEDQGRSMPLRARNHYGRMVNFLSVDFVPKGMANLCFNITLENNVSK